MEMGAKKKMAYSESVKQSQLRYQRESVTQIKMNLVKNTDADILAWLNSQENKQGYLKELIRADMAKHGFTPKKEENEETN